MTEKQAKGKRPPRHHLDSLLMRESLLDKDVEAKTETAVFRMLPDSHVIKVGGRSIFDRGREGVFPIVEQLRAALRTRKLIVGTGGGVRTRHVFSIGLDLGLPTGALAQFAVADALGTAHMLGTLLAPEGVVAIPPEMFGHLLPLFLKQAPGVIFNGVPPYSIWEHPPALGRIPPHRTDAGCLLLAECFGSKSVTLVKDVDGLYCHDPKLKPNAELIPRISSKELQERNLETLPFDRVLLEILDNARQVTQFQVINGMKPGLLLRALDGEHVGTIVHADPR